MPLSFPIATDARTALDAPDAARTLAEARERAGVGVELVSEWLRPEAREREALAAKADLGVGRGFVQLYEDAKGQPVLAVTFWKPQSASRAKPTTTTPPKRSAGGPAAPSRAPVEDHTDDLYFARASARTKRRKKTPDPKQLDLFAGPEPQGHEHRDPDNPSVVLVDEEGDGETSGLAQEVVRRKDEPPTS